MKILLINNNTIHLKALSLALAGHDVEVQNYQPGIEFRDTDKDLVILSGGGGEGLEIRDKITRGKLWYQDEMNFVRTTDKPILGICMGFEVIVSAFGSQVNYRPELLHGHMPSYTTAKGEKLLGERVINQLESHYWYVPEVSEKQFDVLAKSPSGIEMVQHREKQIMGTQFHPEGGGSVTLPQLIQTFC